MKQFVAQPGQTTNDSTVPANEKEEARSRRAQNKKEAHGTYSGASALKRSTCRGMCCVVKQLVSQKSQVMRVNRLQPLTRNPRTDRHGAFDAKERTQLDPVTAIRPRFATSKTRGCYLMRAPARTLNRLPFFGPIFAVGRPLDDPGGPRNQLKKSQKAGSSA